MRSFVLSLFSAGMMVIISCGDGNVVIQEDPSIQAAIDSATIVNYLSDLGYESEDIYITNSGVRYVILDEGESPTIQESDIVSFFYTGKLLNDTIFDTSLKSVADSIRIAVAADTVGRDDVSNIELFLLSRFAESRNYIPYEFTYSRSGWTLSTSNFINGYIEGISGSFNKVGAGGKILIVIPSGQGYGTAGSGLLIPPNTVIAFELFPDEVVPQ